MQLIEGRHELGQIKLMFLCEALLSESMIRIPRFPVMRRAQGYG